MIRKTMVTGFRFLVLLLVFIQLKAVASVDKTEAAGVIATYAYKDLDRVGAITPLKVFVEKTLSKNPLGAKAAIKVLSSPNALSDIKVLENSKNSLYQIIVPNLAGYLTAINKSSIDKSSGFVPLAVPGNPDGGESDYKSVIIASKKSNITTLDELVANKESLKVGMVWKDSTSGGIVPTSQLLKAGIVSPGTVSLESAFTSFEYLGSHQAALEALLNSDIQVAGFALGVLKEKLATNPEVQKQINLLWTSEAIPYGGLLCRSKIPALCEKIKSALLKNDPAALAVLQGLKMGWPEFKTASQFVEIDNAKMKQLAAAMASK